MTDKQSSNGESDIHSTVVAWIGRVAGPVLASAVYWLMPGEVLYAACATAAIGTLMAVWWMTEALPLPVTSLLPIVLFPLAGVFPSADSPIAEAAAPYANPYIFLFMGGFMIALAVERWNLHRRLALLTVFAVGTRPRRLVAGFMIATAGLSMWISNTATTVMMLPIGLSLIALLQNTSSGKQDDTADVLPEKAKADGSEAGLLATNFGVCLMLGIAYAASIGGLGTIIGTPPNTVLAGFLADRLGIEIGFGQWMLLALPLVVVFLFIAWLLLTRIAFPIQTDKLPGGRELIRQELAKLGRLSRGEVTVLIVFVATALAWIVRGPITSWVWLVERLPAVANIDDTMIALVAAISLFFIPVNLRRGIYALDWATARKLPWGILLLFGGGLSLANAVQGTGLADWIGQQVYGMRGLPVLLIVTSITAIVILLTEITSNTATANAFLPILAGVATGLKIDPLLLLPPAALAASCAFMLPVATPPNAIVFGSGHVTIGQMVRGGAALNVVGAVLIPLLMYALGAWVLGVKF